MPESLRCVRFAIELVIPLGFELYKKDMAKRSTIMLLPDPLGKIMKKYPAVKKMQKTVLNMGALTGR